MNRRSRTSTTTTSTSSTTTTGAVTCTLLLPLTLLLSSPSAVPAEKVPDPGRGTVLSAVLGSRATAEDLVPGRRETSLWGWPLAGVPEIVKPYDPPARRWLSGHRGIDLSGVEGEDVLAVDAGVVSYSGVIAGVGIVSVTHASGLRSTYQPVADRVAKGTRVGRGDRIGTLDVGGHCVLHDCLHLGARRGEDYVDPTPLLMDLELTLLPLGER